MNNQAVLAQKTPTYNPELTVTKDGTGNFKTIQEAITLIVFMGFTLIFFREEKLAWNHLVGFGFLVAAVFFVFKKWY